VGQISEEARRQVREQANDRCGYCQSLQKYVMGILEIEHIMPKSAGGLDEEDNLWLACRPCNSYKGTQFQARDPMTKRNVKLFNPRKQKWSRHFEWINNGTHILGITATGRATVLALQLNNSYSVIVRKAWVSVGWHPPVE
jgi:hypothetical protein